MALLFEMGRFLKNPQLAPPDGDARRTPYYTVRRRTVTYNHIGFTRILVQNGDLRRRTAARLSPHPARRASPEQRLPSYATVRPF